MDKAIKRAKASIDSKMDKLTKMDIKRDKKCHMAEKQAKSAKKRVKR